MAQSPIPAIFGSAIVSGFVLHQLFFKRVEVDQQPVLLAFVVFTSPFLLAVVLQRASEEFSQLWYAWIVAFLTVSTSLLSLFVNILVYRAFFHPLKDFPGPFGAKLSKLWTLRKVIQSGTRWYLEASKLQTKYGDYVRTGPREILIFDSAAINPILGFTSKTGKGPFYDSMEVSVSTTRDKDFHKLRRRVWDTAMKNALSDYGPRIEGFTNDLIARIGTCLSKPVIVNELCIHYSYDVMSALAYGESMGFVKGQSTEVADTILSNIQDGVDAIGLLLHVPWLMKCLTTFSFCIGPMKRWNQWSEEQVIKRRAFKNPKPDIMGHLLANTEDTAAGRTMLNAESRIIVSAGSDTTATALSAIFVELACNPSYCAKIRDEVSILYSTNSFNSSQPHPFLDGVINEGMRLHPSVLFGSQRVTPPEGMTINGIFIPGDTVISISPYQVFRDPRNFPRPNNFIPERWSSQPELVLNKLAFMPFLTGPYSCPGKALALMELRSVIGRVVNEYDFSFPPKSNFDRESFFSKVKDHFISGLPKQELVFEKKK